MLRRLGDAHAANLNSARALPRKICGYRSHSVWGRRHFWPCVASCSRLLRKPKNRGPFQCAPVISLATSVSERYRFRLYRTPRSNTLTSCAPPCQSRIKTVPEEAGAVGSNFSGRPPRASLPRRTKSLRVDGLSPPRACSWIRYATARISSSRLMRCGGSEPHSARHCCFRTLIGDDSSEASFREIVSGDLGNLWSCMRCPSSSAGSHTHCSGSPPKPVRTHSSHSPSHRLRSLASGTQQNKHPTPADTAEGDFKKMERAKLANTKKTDQVNAKSARAPLKTKGHKPKAEKLVCHYCGSDDLAPSFVKRRDRRCRKCFSKRYGSAAPAKKARNKN